MKLICISEAIRQDGSKIMEFTKGKIYDAIHEHYGNCFKIKDDKGNSETFFNPYVMFKVWFEKTTKTKKPTPAQLKVLQKMNDEKLIIQYNNWLHKSSEFYKPQLIGIDKISLITFNSLKKSGFIEQKSHEKTDNWNIFYQISELGKQALNEQQKTN